MKTFTTMLKTELKLSLRGMDMLIFAICMPLAVLIMLGVLYGNKPAFPGASYTFLEQSFAALATISICAGGVMGLPLVIAEYRSRKILKHYQVTPVSPALILFVQVVIYTLYAVTSLTSLFVVAKCLFGLQLHGSILLFLSGYGLVLLSMYSIGMMVGGLAPNTKIAGILASILYFPMLLFSGATLPYEIMPASLKMIADMLPLTHGIKLLKAASLGLSAEQVALPIFVMVIIAIICSTIAIRFFQWE